jgi:hypothetical protein
MVFSEGSEQRATANSRKYLYLPIQRQLQSFPSMQALAQPARFGPYLLAKGRWV